MSNLTKACDVCARSGFEISSLPKVCHRCGWKVENLPAEPSAEYEASLEAARSEWAERTLVSEESPILECDAFEYPNEWKSRLESSIWRAGSVRLEKKAYDIGVSRYTLRPDWADWLNEMKQSIPASVTLEAERDIARKLYNEQPDSGYTVALRLVCNEKQETVSAREYLMAISETDLLPLQPLADEMVQPMKKSIPSEQVSYRSIPVTSIPELRTNNQSKGKEGIDLNKLKRTLQENGHGLCSKNQSKGKEVVDLLDLLSGLEEFYLSIERIIQEYEKVSCSEA